MKRIHGILFGMIVCIFALSFFAVRDNVSLAAEEIIYVDADALGANNGTSWADAYTDLQPALEAALAGDQIWVAAGIYNPTVEHGGTGDRYKSFEMKRDVAIYGGFDPSTGDIVWEDRDWENNLTILSGDLNRDDGPDYTNNAENSYHVVYNHSEYYPYISNSAILDGFTITAGNANSDPMQDRGSGMFNWNSSPTLNNCTISDNWALRAGAGMYNYYSSPILNNCIFSGNVGGGMGNAFSSPTLDNCTFSGNFGGSGAGLATQGYSVILNNCYFFNNTSNNNGGGIFHNGGSIVITNCIFAGNSAVETAGGMWSAGGSLTLTNSIFTGNSAQNYAGGMFLGSNSSITITNSAFLENSAKYGGAMVLYESSPAITNVTFYANSANIYGGVMYNNYYSMPIMTNTIMWGNTPSEIFNVVESAPIITYSDIQGGHLGEGNIDADPLFVDAANGNLHLGQGSPAIDAGTNTVTNLPLLDYEGDDRILDGDGDGTAIVDMGVDEAVYIPPAPLVVEIDIRPTSSSNIINLDSRSLLPVAVLTSVAFDAALVDPDTVLCAGAAPSRSVMQDVDRDGDLDLLLYFKIQDLALDENSTEAALTAETYDGTLIEGTDRVKVR